MTKLLSLKTIGEVTNSSMPTVLDWIHHKDPERRLPSVRLGIKILVKESDFDEWLDRQLTTGKSEARQRGGRNGARSRRARKAASDGE